MKSLSVNDISQHPKYAKILLWTKLISITGSAQILVQALGMVTGILIIRLLSTQEYAYYTIANTMLGTMVILSDGGIGIGVMTQGGKVWTDKNKLGSVMATGLDLRNKFAAFSLIVSIPVLGYLLWHQGAPVWTIVFITVALVPAFLSALSDSLLEIGPKLHQDIKPLQMNQVIVSIFRFILSAGSLFFLPFTFIAILANGIPRIYGNLKLKKIANKFADESQQPDPEHREAILKIVKSTLPGSIYYCLAGQITIWLITLFGTTASIAQVGALGRLSMILSIFSVLFATLLTPRFARFPSDKKLLLTRFLQVLSAVVGFSLLTIALVYIAPFPFLWVLGKGYEGLNSELLLSMTGGCITLISGSMYALATSRGWIMPPLILISLNLLAIAIGVALFDVSSLTGVLLLNILIGTVQVFMLGVFFLLKVKRITN